MAKLPDIQSVRPVARPTRGIASISGAAAAVQGNALSDIGGEISRFGDVLFDREQTAIATDRDTMVSDQIRDLIYNPETGFAGLNGQAAVNARPKFMEDLEAIKAKAYDGLTSTAKLKLEGDMNRRMEGALGTIERHTLQERDTWMQGASQARMESAYNDSLVNPGATAGALSIIESTMRETGRREGWGAEKTELEVGKAKSKVYANQVQRISTSDPIMAMEYLRQNEDSMSPVDVANLEATLTTDVKRAVGRRMGAQAAVGRVDPLTFGWSKYAVGGAAARSDSFTGLDPEYASRVATMLSAADSELGEGALKITSAYRSPEKQAELYAAAIKKYGSEAAARKWVAPPGKSRHNSGTAVDFAGADGGLLRNANSREAQWIKQNAARFGLSVPMDWEPWQVEMAGSRGGSVSPAINLNSGVGIDALLEIQDPVEREAALGEYALRTSIAEGQQKAERAAAQDEAFQMIEAGGSLDTLPTETRQALGQAAMTSLHSYQATLARGDVVETNQTRYYELRQMQSEDAPAFRGHDFLLELNNLSKGDWQKMVDAQTKPDSDITTSAASTLMSTASRQIGAAGIDPTPDVGSDDYKTVSGLQSRLLRWQDAFVESNGRAPSKVEIDDQIGRELLPLVIDAPGFTGDSDKQETTLIQLQQMNLSETQLADTSIRILDTDVPAAVINEQIIALKEAGIPVTAYNLTDRIVSMFEAAGIR